MRFSTVVIFGGAGFIGTKLVEYLQTNNLAKHIYVADIAKEGNTQGVNYVFSDVRKDIDLTLFPEFVDLVINLAAVHREPGHEAREYFETNLLGAENVTEFATRTQCHHIYFTSSIAPYGVAELPTDEETLPVPFTAYGSSKLCAEKIHQTWMASDPLNKLVIVRPGVVFGPGEGGNVTRLVKGVLQGKFFYLNNQQCVKAGGYVYDLCNSFGWAMDRVDKSDTDRCILYNFTLSPTPVIQDYVENTLKTAELKKKIVNINYYFLLVCALLAAPLFKILGRSHPFHHVRVKKLRRINNIQCTYLKENGFKFQYSMLEAFRHWKGVKPSDWESK